MARLRAEIKRGWLRSLWRTAQTSKTSLDEALAQFQSGCHDLVSTGRVLIGSGAAGFNSSFVAPTSLREISEEEVFALSEEFIALCENTKRALIAGGTAEPTDQQVFEAMMQDDGLQTVRSAMGDYTTLRYPTFGPTR